MQAKCFAVFHGMYSIVTITHTKEMRVRANHLGNIKVTVTTNFKAPLYSIISTMLDRPGLYTHHMCLSHCAVSHKSQFEI